MRADGWGGWETRRHTSLRPRDGRVGNAAMVLVCNRCGERFPRMYREAGLIVCSPVECRP